MRMMHVSLAILGALAAASPAFAAPWDFVLTNESGKDIKTVDIAETGSETWVANEVNQDNGRSSKDGVKNGGRLTVNFDKAGAECRYDIRATFKDDTTQVWSKINICDNAFITVRYNAAGEPTFAAN